jgi:hypothetical protein
MRFILMAILVGLLTACGSAELTPSSQLVRDAIALQLNLTQQQLSQQLYSSPPSFKITQLRIIQQEPLVIQQLPAYHIRGTYNLTMQLPQRQLAQQQNPFDVYVQRQKEGKTWRLARPQFTDKDTQAAWLTYLVE